VNADGSKQLEWADLSYMDHIYWLDNKNFIAYSCSVAKMGTAW
jgi:hypothetical protein